MKREELYVGMRVRINQWHEVNGININGYVGTVIDLTAFRITAPHYEALVEFDDNINGHNGLNWGAVAGKDGHCFWTYAWCLEPVIENTEPEHLNISVNEFFT